jgi:hypothetical protein
MDVVDAIKRVPPFTRYYMGLIFLFALCTTYRILSPYSLILDFDKLLYSLQVYDQLSMINEIVLDLEINHSILFCWSFQYEFRVFSITYVCINYHNVDQSNIVTMPSQDVKYIIQK